MSINNSWLGEKLINFPVLVNLSSSFFDFSKVKSNGEDIRFTASDGITLLNYEIENWNKTSGSADIWVSIPEIDPSGTPECIFMYYNNPAAESFQNAQMTWANDYVMVDHFEGNAPISSGNNPNYLSQNSNTKSEQVVNSTIAENGKIGNGLSLNGINSYSEIQSNPIMEPAQFTIEVWVDPVSVPSYSSRIIEKDSPWSSGWRFELWSSKPVSAAFCAVDSTYGSKYVVFGNIPLNKWTYLVGVYKSGYMATYVNGQLIQIDTNVTMVNYGGSYLTLGAAHSFTYFFNGTIDEFRISNVTYSDAWIKGQYLSMSDNLITFGEITSSRAR